MTISEARKEISEAIIGIYDRDEANNIAEIALEHVSGLARSDRILRQDNNLSPDERKLLSQVVYRLRQHEPIQYITNEAWFAGMKLYVDKNVLIPRPETEELVDWVIRDVKRETTNVKKIVDVGTGSGCIAIALKKGLPNAEVWGCDVNDETLNIARMNADTFHAAIDFVTLNFLDREQRRQLPRVDIIVSNPPYLPERDKEEMKKNVIEFEPATALFVPDNDATIFYQAIANFGKEKLNKPGSIYVEIHESLGRNVIGLFQSQGYEPIELKKDLQGKDRMVKAILQD